MIRSFMTLYTQQTCHMLTQRYKKKWVDNEDFYYVQIVIYLDHSPFNIITRAGRGTVAAAGSPSRPGPGFSARRS